MLIKIDDHTYINPDLVVGVKEESGFIVIKTVEGNVLVSSRTIKFEDVVKQINDAMQ